MNGTDWKQSLSGMFPVKQNRASWTSAKLGIVLWSDFFRKSNSPAYQYSKMYLTMAENWTVGVHSRTANWHDCPNAFSECATYGVVFPGSLEVNRWQGFYKCKKLSCISFPGIYTSESRLISCGMDSLQLPDSLEVLMRLFKQEPSDWNLYVLI